MSAIGASLLVPIQIISEEFEIYLTNLRYALEGAARQDTPCEKILIDYMSSSSYVVQLQEYANIFDFTYIRDVRDDSLWSRGRALNIGIKHASGDIILFFDADCVLPENYVRSHIDSVAKGTFTYSPFLPTKQEIKKSGKYKDLIKQKELIRPTFPTSYSHKSLRKDWITEHGAFDEDYRGWGAEDDALWAKLVASGQKPIKIDQHPIHLWHPTWQVLMNQAGRQQEQEESLRANRAKYFEAKGEKVPRISTKRKMKW
jgi:hypothetical protein